MERIHERERHQLHPDCALLGGAIWQLQFLQTGELKFAQFSGGIKAEG